MLELWTKAAVLFAFLMAAYPHYLYSDAYRKPLLRQTSTPLFSLLSAPWSGIPVTAATGPFWNNFPFYNSGNHLHCR